MGWLLHPRWHDNHHHDHDNINIEHNIKQHNLDQLKHDDDNNDHYDYDCAMHRRLHVAMVCGRQHMAEIRSWQLLDGLLVPGTNDAGNCRWRVSDGELWTADMSGVLWEYKLLSA